MSPQGTRRVCVPLRMVVPGLLALAMGMARGQDTPQPQSTPPAPPAPVPQVGAEAGVGVAWFPLEPGRRWWYQVDTTIEGTAGDDENVPENARHVLEAYVTDPQTVDGRQVAVLEWKLDNDLAQRCYFVTRDGVLLCVKRVQGYGEHMRDWPLAPDQPTARDQMAAGDEWAWEGKAGPTPGRQTFRVVRQEPLETPAGTFDTLVLEISYEGEDDSRGTITRWLARGVGIVKEVTEVRTASAVFRTTGVLTRQQGRP